MRHEIRNPGLPRGTKSKKSRKFRHGLMALALGLTGSAVAAPAAKTVVKSGTKTASAKRSWFQVGRASWYGGHFNGRKTAIGEKYDMNALTCAHRTLPLGSWVKVTNL